MEITKDIKYVGVNDYDECSKQHFGECVIISVKLISL